MRDFFRISTEEWCRGDRTSVEKRLYIMQGDCVVLPLVGHFSHSTLDEITHKLRVLRSAEADFKHREELQCCCGFFEKDAPCLHTSDVGTNVPHRTREQFLFRYSREWKDFLNCGPKKKLLHSVLLFPCKINLGTLLLSRETPRARPRKRVFGPLNRENLTVCEDR